MLGRKALPMALYCGHRGHPWGWGGRGFPEVKETPHSTLRWGLGSGDGIWEIRLCGNEPIPYGETRINLQGDIKATPFLGA